LDTEFIKWLATLGIGGVLAGFIFIFYRKDIKQYTELWKSTTERLMEIVGDNTASIAKLTVILDSLERNAVRLSDLKEIIRIEKEKVGLTK
jgi:flagellar biosynthesis component FlhA